MKLSVNKPYTISRIRLVNFHNLVNETIPVANGGHLFLLGDNGSGKTTILDAVHYVLSAGESMEFNAAARVTGRQTEGRRLQGIIMRYNVDTGSLNKVGGVTYAALEISGRLGRPMTVGIGMSVGTIDESPQRWGIIRECSLEEIPFLINDEVGTRPRTREEMKQALGEGSGFYNIGTYRAEIANRLFGGGELFDEVCKFLKMGKAYREIAARAEDYHVLFKSLLPEPKTELFERIIKAMKDLDGSRVDLDRLENKSVYLHELEDLIKGVDDAQDDQLRYAWMVQYLVLADFVANQGTLEAEKARLQDELATLYRLDESKKQELLGLRRLLGDLQTKDVNGLVRQEKDCTADLERVETMLGKRQADLVLTEKRQREVQKHWNKGREYFIDKLRKFHSDLGSMASGLTFPLTGLLTALDTAYRAELSIDPFALINAMPISPVINQSEMELSLIRTKTAQGESKLATLQNRNDIAKQAVEKIEKQAEAMPEVKGFHSALLRLRNSMLDTQPLYMGLEWKLGLTQGTMAAVEEMIGDAVLGTLLVQERDWDATRELIYGEFSELRVSQVSQSVGFDKVEIPSWIHENFDIAKSNPLAIECLAREMESRKEPHDEKWKQWHVGLFRAHEHRLLNKTPRLIGIERRRQEWHRQVQHLRQEKDEIQKEIRMEESRLEEVKKAGALLEKLLGLLRQNHESLKQSANEIVKDGQELKYIVENILLQRNEIEVAVIEEKRFSLRLSELRSLITHENLDKLEQKIMKLQRQIKNAENELDSFAVKRGQMDAQLEGANDKISTIQKHILGAESKRAQIQNVLSLRHKELLHDNIPDYILRIRKGQQFKTVEAVSKAEGDAVRSETVASTRLEERIKDPVFGATYGFYYEKTENRLLDRRGQLLSDVSIELKQKLKEQRELINTHTHELFRKIIMAELVDFLKRHVIRLNDMVKKVNQVLSEHDFGGKRYRLQLTPALNHKHILEIVRNYNHFATASTEEDLQAFFNDHKEEILTADVNRIPAVLDYRNWYQYEMRMESVGTEGVVMDRRTKSIGSGGEQAVPNYLLILTIAHFLYQGTEIKLHALLFDEAFYGIDSSRRDQILGFATDLGLQLLVTSPDQDGVKREIRHSTSVLVVKDKDYNVHLYPYIYENKELPRQLNLLEPEKDAFSPAKFEAELSPENQP